MKQIHTNNSDFQKIFKQHHKDALQYIFRLVHDTDIAEDLTQEVFIRVHRYFDRYNPLKGTYINWILTICRNVVFDYFKKEKIKNFHTPEQPSELQQMEVADTTKNPSSIVEKEFVEQKLHLFIQELPKQYRDIVFLKHFQKKHSSEIAQLLNISERTARRNYVKALEVLRRQFLSAELDMAVLFQ